MLLLDILASADNNVQTASEKLTSMGYEKRDATAPKPPNRNREEQLERERKEAETPPLAPVIKYKSIEEKQKSNAKMIPFCRPNEIQICIPLVKGDLQERYKDVAEKIITMALESVDYSEEKAHKILQIVLQDDQNVKEETKRAFEEKPTIENEAENNDTSKQIET